MGERIYLCLEELISEDSSGYEFYSSLPPTVRSRLLEMDVTTFSALQRAAREAERLP